MDPQDLIGRAEKYTSQHMGPNMAGAEKVPFEAALSRVDAAFYELSTSMDMLGKRLSPVLQERTEKDSKTCTKPPALSRFDDFIDSIEMRLRNCTDGLVEIRERLSV